MLTSLINDPRIQIALLILCGLGFLAGIAGVGYYHAVPWVRERFHTRREIKEAYDLAIVEDTLHVAMIEKREEILFPKRSYRHNIHCPKCGRFAKKVLGSDQVTDCKHHGVQVRWKDIPVDWATIPWGPVTLHTQPILITPDMSLISISEEIDELIDEQSMSAR